MLAGFKSFPGKLNQPEDTDGQTLDRIFDDTVTSSPRPLDSLPLSSGASISRSLSQRFTFNRAQSFMGRRPKTSMCESPTSPVFAEVLEAKLQPFALADKVDKGEEQVAEKTPQGDLDKAAEGEAPKVSAVGKEDPRKTQSSDVGGSRFKVHGLEPMPKTETGEYQRTAGEAAVYKDIEVGKFPICVVIF